MPPSPELVERVRDLYHKRVPDVRFLIPVINGLEKVQFCNAHQWSSKLIWNQLYLKKKCITPHTANNHRVIIVMTSFTFPIE